MNLEEDLFRVERSVEDLELNITVVEEADGIYSLGMINLKDLIYTVGMRYVQLVKSIRS